MREKPEQPEEPGKSKKPQQQQTISLRISDALLTRLERVKQLISSKTGEKVSTSDAAKQLLESTREDRLDAGARVPRGAGEPARQREVEREARLPRRDHQEAGVLRVAALEPPHGDPQRVLGRQLAASCRIDEPRHDHPVAVRLAWPDHVERADHEYPGS